MARALPLIAAAALSVISGGSLTPLFGALLSTGLSFLQQALTPDPGRGRFANRAQSRTSTLRQPVVERRLPFGELIISGALTFYEATENNRYHHMVVTLGDAPTEAWDAIDIVWLDDTPVFNSEIDGDGNVTAGKFAGKVRIKKHLGGPDQTADADLIAEIARLDANFRGRGIAYLYLRVDWDERTFSQGLPNPRALCRTNSVLDTRDDTRRFSTNGVLCLREYLTDTTLGLAYETADFDDDFTDAGANTADEIVDVLPVGHAVVEVSAGDDELRLAVAGSGAPLRLETGDRVEIFTDGSAPGGLAVATSYYAIVDRLVGASFEDDAATTILLDAGDYSGDAATAIAAGNVDAVHGTSIHAGIQLASSYANAMARTAVAISSAGTGRHVLVRTGEPRYAVSGLAETAATPIETIREMLSGMAGRLAWTGGVFRILPAAWRSPVMSLDETDLMGAMTVRPKHSRLERFNAVKGIMAGHLTVGEPSDYPAVIDSAFVAADGGKRIFADRDRPWTSRASTAQRLSKIDLARHRREKGVRFPTTMTALQATPGEVISLSNTRRGWSSKTFEIEEQQDADFGEGGSKVKGVVLVLSEIDATAFQFDPASDETVKPPRAIPPGGNPQTVAPPGTPAVTEELYATRDGAGVKALARVSWSASQDAFVTGYRVQFRADGAATWETAREQTPDLFAEIRDIEPGLYDFRVQAINQLGFASDFVARDGVEISGLLAPPADVSGLTISSIGGLAILRWDWHADLDVRIGGEIRFRHSKATSGASWSASVSIGEAIPGSETVAVLPLKPGTYLARAYDSSGVPSDSATAVLASAGTALAFANVDSLAEHPGFSGAHAGTVAIDSLLKLAGADDIDDWGAIDDITDWDSEGGLVTAGTYDFAGGIDQGVKSRVRLTAEIEATVVNTLDLIDARTASIDDWSDFDGTEGADGDVQIWVRETDDDPAGSPTFGAWQRLDSAEFNARAFDFQARLSTDDPAFNIHVTELSVEADEVI